MGHLEETKVKNRLDHVSPWAAVAFRHRCSSWLRGTEMLFLRRGPLPQAEVECDTRRAHAVAMRRRCFDVRSVLSQVETDRVSCVCLVQLRPPEAFPQEPKASQHIQTLLRGDHETGNRSTGHCWHQFPVPQFQGAAGHWDSCLRCFFPSHLFSVYPTVCVDSEPLLRTLSNWLTLIVSSNELTGPRTST